MWSFSTARFEIAAFVRQSAELVNVDDNGEAAAKVDSGEWEHFDTEVAVFLDGAHVASDYLFGSIYAEPSEFFSAHRDPDATNRNCFETNKRHAICHYFPDMVKEAVRCARSRLAKRPALRVA